MIAIGDVVQTGIVTIGAEMIVMATVEAILVTVAIVLVIVTMTTVVVETMDAMILPVRIETLEILAIALMTGIAVLRTISMAEELHHRLHLASNNNNRSKL